MQLLDAPRPVARVRPVRWAALPAPLLTVWLVLGLISAAPVVINMINTPQEQHSVDSALRIGSAAWAVLFATPAQIGQTSVTLMPWGFALIAVALFWWAGSRMTRLCRSRWPLSGGVVLLGAVLTGVMSAVIGRFAELGVVSFQPLQVGAFGFAFAAIGLGLGLAFTLRAAQPPIVRSVVRGAAVATFALIGVGALLLLIGFLRNIAQAQELLETMQPDVGPGFLIMGLQLGYLPVFLIWATSYLTGAGFVIGPLVSPFVEIAAPIDVPPVPILAAVPTAAPAVAWIFPAAVVVIGALATVAALRRLAGPRWIGFAVGPAVAVAAAAIMTLLATLSSGALGVDRLADIGPTPAAVAWLTAGLLLLGSLPMAVLRARV